MSTAPQYTPERFLPHEREFLDKLDDFQRKYVFSGTEGVKSVIAVAGSGKTHASLSRALYLVREHGVRPKAITLLAFNNKAANELKERWGELANQALPFITPEDQTWALPELSISTIHSYGFGLFSKFLPSLSIENPIKKALGTKYSILSEYHSLKLYKRVAEEVLGDVVEGNSKAVLAFYYHLENLAAQNLIYPILAIGKDFQHPHSEQNPSALSEVLDTLIKPGHVQVNKTPILYLLQNNNHMLLEVINAKGQNKPNPLSTEGVDKVVREQLKVAVKALSEFKGWDTFIKPRPKVLELQTQIIRQFYLEKYKARSLTFSDMLLLPNILFQHVPELKAEFQKTQSEHLIADEAQDVDPLQFSLLYQMWTKTFTLVGDPLQFLYGFRSAQYLIIEELKLLAEAYSPFIQGRPYGFEKFSILNNYRCPPAVVGLSNKAAQKIEGMEYKEAIPFNGPKERSIVIREYVTPQEELAEVAADIKALQNEGVELHDVMVLARTNRVLAQLEPHMIRQGLPYRMRLDSRSIINQNAYLWITAVYSLIVNPNDVTALLEVVESVKGFGSAYIKKLDAELNKPENGFYINPDKLPVLERVFNQLGNTKQRELAQKMLKGLIEPILSIHPMLLARGKGVREVNNFIANMMQANFNLSPDRIKQADEGQDLPEDAVPEKPDAPHSKMDLYSLKRVLDFTESIYDTCVNIAPESITPIQQLEEKSSTGLFDGVFAPKTTVSGQVQKESGLRKSELVLFQEVYGALYSSFTEDVEEEVNEAGELVPVKKASKYKNKVLLSTIHSAKGAQAEYIFYCGMALFQPIPEEEMLAEACCHYVALTRAKQRLYISHSHGIEGFDGNLRKGHPNPFFHQTMDHIKEMIEEKAQKQRTE